MNATEEKAQQINDVGIDTTSVRDGSGVNDPGTGSKIDAPLTQAGSPDVRQGNIYFVRAGEAIKIGFSTNSKKRLAALQTSNAESLQLLGTIRGTRQDERDLHERFCHLHLRGEWFRDEEELTQFIASRQPEPKRPRASRETMTTISKLVAKRRLHGKDTPVGHRYSNLIEQVRTLEHASDDERRTLAGFMANSVADIERLTAA